jgi:hypothetical protein
MSLIGKKKFGNKFYTRVNLNFKNKQESKKFVNDILKINLIG